MFYLHKMKKWDQYMQFYSISKKIFVTNFKHASLVSIYQCQIKTTNYNSLLLFKRLLTQIKALGLQGFSVYIFFQQSQSFKNKLSNMLCVS